MNRRPFIAAAILAALAAGSAWYWLSRPASAQPWLGYAEADYVYVAPVLEGRLTALAVARGDQVAAGAPLFAQDSTDDLAARDQAKASLAQARATLANQLATRDYNIAQARADLASAEANEDQLATDLARNEHVLGSGGVTRQAVDLLRAQTLSAQADVQAAQAKLALQLSDSAIQAQQAAVQAAAASLVQAQWRLAQRTVTAPEAGLIADTFAKPGETMAPGAPVLMLLPPENIRVRFFVPETVLAQLHQGQQVVINCDSCPANLRATISFIAAQPQYTPPVIYSEGTRGNLVYLIEARPPLNEAPCLKPGQPVGVSPAP